MKTQIIKALILATVLGFALPHGASAQSKPPVNPNVPPPPPPAPASQESSSKKSTDDGSPVTPPPPTSGNPANQQSLPAFDPLTAMKDIEVGQYYMQKGNFDAAIDRFQHATEAQPTYAEPWRLLGEAYEKKQDLGESVKCYQKYLKIYPHSPMRKKLEEHIADLQKTLQRETQKRKGN